MKKSIERGGETNLQLRISRLLERKIPCRLGGRGFQTLHEPKD